jgi:hypothetical protein
LPEDDWLGCDWVADGRSMDDSGAKTKDTTDQAATMLTTVAASVLLTKGRA